MIQREDTEEQNMAINYAIHMPPITKLQMPELLDHDTHSLLDIICAILYATLPLLCNYILNSTHVLINLYLASHYLNNLSFEAVGLGSLICCVFGFLVIENIGSGFAIICSYFLQKQQVGYLYQKTLGLNFLLCILITPILYISDYILIAIGFNQFIIKQSTNFIWALVPSFYLYSFYDTTKNYLHFQGVIFPSIIISFIATIINLGIAYIFIVKLQLQLIGAAWATNLTNLFACLILYLYIVYKQPTKSSWVQWNIKATNNIHRYVVEIITYSLYPYFQVLAFNIFCLIACYLKDTLEVCAQLTLYSIHLILFSCFMGISHCLNRSISLSIQENDIVYSMKKVSLGIITTIIFSAVAVINIFIHRQWFMQFLHSQSKIVVSKVLPCFLIAIMLTGTSVVLLGILKTLRIKSILIIWFVSEYIFGLFLGILFAFYFNYGLLGLWIGWCIGISIFFILSIRILLILDWKQTFKLLRQKFKIINENIRASRMQLAFEKDQQ